MNTVNSLEKIKSEFHENINSHVFLLETDNLESCLQDVKGIIKEKISANSVTEHQIDTESYLELIIIRPEEKEIKKDQILMLQNRLKSKPILSNYLFYIIIPAEALSEISSNKLLKTIEEPNENVISFLITKNSDQILPTIKSRCEYAKVFYNEKTEKIEIDENLLAFTKDLIYSIEEKDHIKFTKIKNDFINKDNHKLVEIIIKDYYNMACNLTSIDYLDTQLIEFIQKNNNYSQLYRKAKFINKFLNKLTENMNADLLLENIFLTLKEVK